MSFRRLPVAITLALLAALAAHLVAFGTSHTMGGTHGTDVSGIALGTLALLALSAIAWIGLGSRRGLTELQAARLLQSMLPGRGRPIQDAAILTLGATLAFSVAETLEGHSPFASLSAPLALAVAAGLVAIAARTATRWLARAGVKLAVLAGDPIVSAVPMLAVLAAFAPGVVRPDLDCGHRGRAPPLQA